MKKKPNGQNFEIVRDYLLKYGPTGAADIQKATKVKGNIYTTLQTMVNRKTIKKVGKVYQPTIETTIKHDIGPAFKAPQPNPIIKTHQDRTVEMLQDEINYIQEGIDSLLIAKNYLERRLEQLTK